MVDPGGKLSFFLDIHVRIDVRIAISISVGPVNFRRGKQVHLQDLT